MASKHPPSGWVANPTSLDPHLAKSSLPRRSLNPGQSSPQPLVAPNMFMTIARQGQHPEGAWWSRQPGWPLPVEQQPWLPPSSPWTWHGVMHPMHPAPPCPCPLPSWGRLPSPKDPKKVLQDGLPTVDDDALPSSSAALRAPSAALARFPTRTSSVPWPCVSYSLFESVLVAGNRNTVVQTSSLELV